MDTKYKFGDIVINEWASKRNPQRVLMVRHNGSRYVHCISRKGKRCKFMKDSELRLRKVAELPFDVWDFVINEQKLRKNLQNTERSSRRDVN